MPKTIFEVAGKRYAFGQRVHATVLRILPFGILVELSDGNRGVIRRRELAWSHELSDQDIKRMVPVGHSIEPVIIGVDEKYKRLNLSLRQAEFDPWRELSKSDKYRVGSIVRGEVVSLKPYGAFVELEAPRGIVGLLHISEVPNGVRDEITDLLWVGDSVEVMIKDMHPKAHRVGLSIVRRLEAQGGHTKSKLKTWSSQLSKECANISSPEISESDGQTAYVIHKTGVVRKILVVEDDRDFAKLLGYWLKALDYTVDITFTGEEAIALGSVIRYDLVFCDMHLPDMQGLDIARNILASRSRTRIVIVTGDDEAVRNADFEDVELAGVFLKPIDWDELAQFLQDLEYGKVSRASPLYDQVSKQQDQFLQRVLASVNINETLKSKLNVILNALYDSTEAEAGFIFEFDTVLRRVSILAGSSALPLYEAGLADLHYSPVSDVAHRGEEILENYVTEHSEARFAYLLRFVYFESCLAFPVDVDDSSICYALFLFHSEPGHFAEAHRQYIMFSAKATELALEKAQMETWIQQQQRLLLAGQLGLSLTHEMNNKLTGIEQYAKNLELDCRDIQQSSAICEDSEFLAKMENRITKILGIVGAISLQNRNYLGLLRGEQYIAVDINALLRDVADLVSALARKQKVHMVYDLDTTLPRMMSNMLRLEHVFLNLMLNAIQNMKEKFTRNRELELKIVTSYVPHPAQFPVQVRFTDRGPGIHRQQFDWIFDMGTGTREGGSGLGLFISQGLIASLGGRLSIEESLMFVGTTFLIELPFVSVEEAA